MRIDTYTRNLSALLFTILVALSLLLVVPKIQTVSAVTLADRASGVNGGLTNPTPASNTVGTTCEVSPGRFITCPSGTSCTSINGQNRCIGSGTITLSPTAIPSSLVVTQPPTCDNSNGDADCNGKIELADFEQWRKEFTHEVSTRLADFNQDHVVTIADFEIWRRNFYAQSQNGVILSPSPVQPVPSAFPSTQALSPTPPLSPFDLSRCTITASAGRQIINGTDGADVICVLSTQNVVYGNGGNDTIYVNSQSNYIDAGAGDDQIILGPSATHNSLIGGEGNDRIDTRAGAGSNAVDGGPGTDTCLTNPTDAVSNCEQ